MIVALICGVIGYLLSTLIRIELSILGTGILFGDYQFYNNCISAHGLIMIFGFIMPIVLGGYINYFMPIIIGYPDMLFPRLNNISFWNFIFAVIFLVSSILIEEGVGTGWTLYPSLICVDFHPGFSIDIAIFAVHLLGISSILNSLNIIGTFWISRKKFVNNLNLFLWGSVFTSILLLVFLPVLAGGVTLILLDRNLNTSFFDCCCGGDVVLFQHLFWFFGHPEVYIIILPVFGLISFVLESVTGHNAFSVMSMIYSMVLISLLGSFVWAHHMFVIGMDLDSRVFFGSLTLLIGLPTCIKLFNWLITIWYSDIILLKESVYIVYMFLFVFIFGGITGLILANAGLDVILHDSYFVVAHFHYVLSLGAIFGVISSFIFFHLTWFNIESHMFKIGMVDCFLFIGLNCIFWPLHELGLLSFPRRITDFPIQFLININIILIGLFFTLIWVLIIILFNIYFFLKDFILIRHYLEYKSVSFWLCNSISFTTILYILFINFLHFIVDNLFYILYFIYLILFLFIIL